ncbi:hypothetical protein PsorP6_013143 [Peronosclerospora sorghi]|uniref:Uncharacterized protein n=1 Tax=Peronosclerospora sorghi TaxID=230839 RepID=A0ACC0WI59_9STRA|nr:hypothetical protein PsorP6_013143 [Peronosclerospora sorghi]
MEKDLIENEFEAKQAMNSLKSVPMDTAAPNGRYFIFYEVSYDVFIDEGTEMRLQDDPALFRACSFSHVEVQEMLAVAIALFVCR